MNKRIKEIRRKAKLTQIQFGERIGLKQNSIAQIEAGTRTPSDAVIKAICREFHIRPEWLVNGEGPMDTPTRSRTLDTVARRYSSSTTFRVMLDVYAQLDEAQQRAIERYIELLYEAYEAGKNPASVALPKGEELEREAEEGQEEIKKNG